MKSLIHSLAIWISILIVWAPAANAAECDRFVAEYNECSREQENDCKNDVDPKSCEAKKICENCKYRSKQYKNLPKDWRIAPNYLAQCDTAGKKEEGPRAATELKSCVKGEPPPDEDISADPDPTPDPGADCEQRIVAHDQKIDRLHKEIDRLTKEHEADMAMQSCGTNR